MLDQPTVSGDVRANSHATSGCPTSVRGFASACPVCYFPRSAVFTVFLVEHRLGFSATVPGGGFLGQPAAAHRAGFRHDVSLFTSEMVRTALILQSCFCHACILFLWSPYVVHRNNVCLLVTLFRDTGALQLNTIFFLLGKGMF